MCVVYLLRTGKRLIHSPIKLPTASWPNTFPDENSSSNLFFEKHELKPELPEVKAYALPAGFPHNPYMPIVLCTTGMRVEK